MAEALTESPSGSPLGKRNGVRPAMVVVVLLSTVLLLMLRLAVRIVSAATTALALVGLVGLILTQVPAVHWQLHA